MVARQSIEAQLKRLGVTVKGWGAAEISELQHILMPSEEITGYAHGWYENGFATLIATNERLLLVDKKLFHLTIEDVRYDMVAEVDFNARVFDSTIHVSSVNKTLHFTSFKQQRLRALTNYVQRRVMELRQQPYMWQQFEQTPVSHDQERGDARQFVPQTAAPAGLPLQVPALMPMRRLTQANPYTKAALTTKHNFLPKVPRRWRPS